VIDIKSLTLIQPWASLICDGRKTIETRSWPTKHRGDIAIHAGKKVDHEACKKFGYEPDVLPRGAIICTVKVVDVVQFPSDKAKPDEYGDFTAGRYGWLLSSVSRIDPPVPASGMLGLWEWDDGKQTRLF
jgi:hypothetical protein